MSLLEVRGGYGGYGGIDILNGVDLALADGQVVVVIGPNGAGKSTLMKAIFGLVGVRAGSIHFGSENITKARPDQLVPKGLSYVPQERNVFLSLTVQENLDLGAYIRTDHASAELEQVFEIFPLLRQRRRQPTGQMSGAASATSAAFMPSVNTKVWKKPSWTPDAASGCRRQDRGS